MKKLKIKKPFHGAGIIIWKEENGKKYVLLGQRACGFAKGKYSSFGGHFEKVDFVNHRRNYLYTAIRETAEETSVIPSHGNHIDKAEEFFLNNPGFELNNRAFRKIHVPHYHYNTYICKASGKMASEKWYKETREHVTGTIKWYSVDELPSPLVFACKLNILKVLKEK